MVDTIVLLLDSTDFTITKPELFRPSATWATSTDSYKDGTLSFAVATSNYDGLRARPLKSIQNASKKELSLGIYKPRLTLFSRVNKSRRPDVILKIELSVPKLLFGNNFVELRYKDFASIINKLVIILEAMGVTTTEQALSHAPVSAIHYSKNIKLTDGSTPYHYINKLKDANIKLSLDVNQTDYRNDGHSYRIRCNSYEVVFYDKIKDLEKARISSKNSLEPDNDIQLGLCDRFKTRHKLEFLRMEVRLNKRKKIKQLLKILNIKTDLTFKKLFKPAISKQVLLYYLDELQQQRPTLIDYKPSNDKGLLIDIIAHNPNLTTRSILMLYGLKKILDTTSPRELRNILPRCTARTWSRLMAEIQQTELPTINSIHGTSSITSPFKGIRAQILAFTPIKINDINI